MNDEDELIHHIWLEWRSTSTHSSSENDSPSPQIPSLSLPKTPFSNPRLTSPTTFSLKVSLFLNSVVSSSPTILSEGKAF